MCSGNGTNFENIVRSCKEDEVVLMIYNKEGCGAVTRANKLGIPSCHIKSNDEDLIRGFLFNERIIENLNQIETTEQKGDDVGDYNLKNTIEATINNIENLTVLGEEMGPITVRSIKSREDYKPLLPEVIIQIDNVQQGSARKTNLGTYYVGLRCSGWAGFAMTFYLKHKDWVTAYCEVDNPHEPYNTIEEPGYSYGLAEHPHIRGGSPCMGNFEGPIKSALNSLNFLGGIIQIKSYINSWNVNSQFTKLTYFKPRARLKINFPLFRLNDEEKVKFLDGLKEVETLNPRSTKIMTYSYQDHQPPGKDYEYNKEDYIENQSDQLEEYEKEYLVRLEQEKAEKAKAAAEAAAAEVAAEAQSRGSMPKGWKPSQTHNFFFYFIFEMLLGLPLNVLLV